MLKSLFIKNFVLIDCLDIPFAEGFSVITGETGAGKSIMLGALSLVLGQRADAKSIKKGRDKCIIEAQFDLHGLQLEPLFLANDLDYDADSCILRRELYATGKSRAFVNDTPVALTILRDLGNRLIDIHSQHQNLLLADNRFQLKVVDSFARNSDTLSAYQTGYARYLLLRKQLNELQELAARAKQEEDYLRFQTEQLNECKLQPGEQELLEQEEETLTHAEEIKAGLYKINLLLHDEQGGALGRIKEALSTTESVARFFPSAAEMVERMRSAYIELDDMATEADRLQESMEFNAGRLEEVKERLNMLYTLLQKHRCASVEELLELQEKYDTQLREIDSYDEQIAALQQEIDSIHKQLLTEAGKLTRQRKQAGKQLAESLVQMILPLGMPNARFRVAFIAKNEPGSDGMDDIQFLFSANKSGELMPVSQTASGGEISRLMLCIKSLIAGYTSLPTIIFDEVDSGVSGDIADKMGDIMRGSGDNLQVLAITHLPQIAAKGRAHYLVFKEDTADQTLTHIRQLTQEERINEIARMLSGATLTDASRANAKELLGF